MDSNLQQFLSDLKKETTDVLNKTNKKIKDTVLAVNEQLMLPKSLQGTPVITQHLRNNWVITTDHEWLDVSGSKENPDNSEQDSSLSMFVGMNDLYLKSNIFFNNNVWYGPRVNYGGDGIAAQKFREKAIQVGTEYLGVVKNE